MKGLICYDSLTGNTKKMAEQLAEGLSHLADWDVLPLKEVLPSDVSQKWEVVLAGAWIDQGYPNKRARQWIETLPPCRLGLFATLGAMPDSDHGKMVHANMESLLVKHQSLGVVLLPGLVDAKLLERVRQMPADTLPPTVKEQMIKAGEESRWATEEEYAHAAAFFRQSLSG